MITLFCDPTGENNAVSNVYNELIFITEECSGSLEHSSYRVFTVFSFVVVWDHCILPVPSEKSKNWRFGQVKSSATILVDEP